MSDSTYESWANRDINSGIYRFILPARCSMTSECMSDKYVLCQNRTRLRHFRFFLPLSYACNVQTSVNNRVCTTMHLRLPCAMPFASSNKSLQAPGRVSTACFSDCGVMHQILLTRPYGYYKVDQIEAYWSKIKIFHRAVLKKSLFF